MTNDTIIKVTNRSAGIVVYELPELNIRREYQYKETKEISFQELKALYNISGGAILIKNYLAVKSEEAVKELDFDTEPEYFYSEEDVIRVMEKGTMDEFLDMLDFAPDGVLELVKSLAVSRELNDMNKRTAIYNKLNFDVTKAIEVKNTKFDDGSAADSDKKEKATRRVVTTPTKTTTVVRRTTVTQ